MAKVVHEFVAECQKGFVPDSFIAEATMLTRLIEGYINEDGEDKEGIQGTHNADADLDTAANTA